MNELVKNLQSFNSKERFFLIGQMLGNTEFKLSAETINELNTSLDLELKIPTDVFSAMDYHLDWLYASLRITKEYPDNNKIYSNEEGIIKAQQEDIDYLVVFESYNKTHIVLIEAKGVTGWDNKQMDSKALRLNDIFGTDGNKWTNVIPHFLLMSPNEPQRLNSKKWPVWMAPDGEVKWLKLSVRENLNRITRCSEDGKSNKNGGYWRKIRR
jgi:hypothetical protein